MPRKGMTVRELVIVVAVIAAVGLAVYPFAQWAWEKRQERLNRELCEAAGDGDWHEVRRLLARGADANAKDHRGWTPLHRAAFWGRKDVTESLLTKGADVDAKDSVGWTPLHWAAEQGHNNIASLLLHRGADGDAKDRVGRTPLHLAQENGHADIAALLKQHGAEE